jgi:hypothetical protein
MIITRNWFGNVKSTFAQVFGKKKKDVVRRVRSQVRKTDGILFVGPRTLCIRFKKFCVENGLSVNHTDVFPIPASNTADVDTMELDEFAPRTFDDKIFTDHCKAICSTGYSLFVDDFQACDKWYDYIRSPAMKRVLSSTTVHRWILLDQVQESYNSSIRQLDLSTLGVPLYQLTAVLRNTTQIADVSLNIRQQRLTDGPCIRCPCTGVR